MKKSILIVTAIALTYLFFTYKPSTSSIAGQMEFGERITYKGHSYLSDWGRKQKLAGYLRRKDRHFYEGIPIITYDLVITSGEFSDPDIVDVRANGGGNYSWSAPRKPTGTIMFYHTVPGSSLAQDKLDELQAGDNIALQVRVSKDDQIKSDTGDFYKLVHSNHKLILVEDVEL